MPEPRRPPKTEFEEVEDLLRLGVNELRQAVLQDGGAFGDASRFALSKLLSHAFERGAQREGYWRAQYSQEHELLEQSERKRRETERELESYRPTPPSAPAARRRAWRSATPPPIPREEPGGRSMRDDEITQRIDIEVPE